VGAAVYLAAMSRSATAESPPLPFTAGEVGRLRRALLEHWDRTRRDLPWRGETDPYRVWVSEVMLQQTRVETVIPYYRRWLSRFPDVGALADATLDDVLLAWQGLGYYRRARGLHAGAGIVRERYCGAVPSRYEELRTLPGVGAYTAGAVASIAFGKPVGAVDGNVRRVLARLLDDARPSARRLHSVADRLVDPARPGDWNQALMDLGASLCAPRAPRCRDCPLVRWCRSRSAGTQEARPAAPTRRAVPSAAFACAVVVDGHGRALVVRRPEGGLLGGLWAFPDVALTDGNGRQALENGGSEPALARAARAAARGAGAHVDRSRPRQLDPVSHRFTHLAATYHPVVLAGRADENEYRRWIPLEGPWPVALPVAQQKIARAAAAAPGDVYDTSK